MGTKELRKRDIWQDSSGENAGVAEKNFYEILLKEFEGSDFRIRSKPKEFKDIYSKIKLSKEVLADIYMTTYATKPILPISIYTFTHTNKSMVSFKQKRIIEIAKSKGFISIFEVENIYPHINQRRNSMSSLEILGYLRHEQDKWIYIKEDIHT